MGGGFVSSLARPGGNTTGFAVFEYGISGKWLALLKEIAPGVTRALVLRDPTTAAGIGQFAAIQAAAPSLGLELSPIDVRNASALERAVAEFARTPNGGVIVEASPCKFADNKLLLFLPSIGCPPSIRSVTTSPLVA